MIATYRWEIESNKYANHTLLTFTFRSLCLFSECTKTTADIVLLSKTADH